MKRKHALCRMIKLQFTQADMHASFFVLTDTTAGATDIQAEGEGNV
jgi:hypothetical protein